MNYRTKNKLLAAMLSGSTLYIKDTGVSISMEYYGTDLSRGLLGKKDKVNELCNVEVTGIPTTKSLKKFHSFHVKRNSHTNKITVDGLISLEHLSLSPYESKAGRLLYDKKGK